MSPQVMNLSHSARLLFVGLITQADDEGRGTADARRLKASIFGGDDITTADVQRWLEEVKAQGLTVVYEASDHGLVYALPSWRNHQSIDRPRPSSYPAAAHVDQSSSVRRALDEPSTSEHRGLVGDRKEGKDLGRIGRDRTPARAHARTRAREPTVNCDAAHEAFGHVRAAYPAFAGNQSDWALAERACLKRIEEGASWEELESAAHRFAAYVAAGGRSGSQFVDLPSKFFGNGLWRQSWTPPPTKAEQRLACNLSAAEEFLRNTEPKA